MEQIKEIEEKNNLESGTIVKEAIYEKTIYKNLENSEEENKDKKKAFGKSFLENRRFKFLN